MKKIFITVASLLFLLEIESIANDKIDSFAVRDWFEKFGENAEQHADKLVSPEEGIQELAEAIEQDFKKGVWKRDEQGQLYSPDMFNAYGGILDKHLEIQLGNLTGRGTQLTLLT